MPKKYSDEFKSDAVQMYLEHPEATYKEIAALLFAPSIRRWCWPTRKAPNATGPDSR